MFYFHVRLDTVTPKSLPHARQHQGFCKSTCQNTILIYTPCFQQFNLSKSRLLQKATQNTEHRDQKVPPPVVRSNQRWPAAARTATLSNGTSMEIRCPHAKSPENPVTKLRSENWFVQFARGKVNLTGARQQVRIKRTIALMNYSDWQTSNTKLTRFVPVLCHTAPAPMGGWVLPCCEPEFFSHTFQNIRMLMFLPRHSTYVRWFEGSIDRHIRQSH